MELILLIIIIILAVYAISEGMESYREGGTLFSGCMGGFLKIILWIIGIIILICFLVLR